MFVYFELLLRVFLLPVLRLSLGSLGLGSQIHVKTSDFVLPRIPNSELSQNQLTPKNCPLTGRMCFISPVTRLSYLRYGKNGDVVCWWRYGCSGTCRFIWLPFFVLGTSRYFRRSSYPWYVPFLLSPRSTVVWFCRRSSVIPCRRRLDGTLLITRSRFDIVCP